MTDTSPYAAKLEGAVRTELARSPIYHDYPLVLTATKHASVMQITFNAHDGTSEGWVRKRIERFIETAAGLQNTARAIADEIRRRTERRDEIDAYLARFKVMVETNAEADAGLRVAGIRLVSLAGGASPLFNGATTYVCLKLNAYDDALAVTHKYYVVSEADFTGPLPDNLKAFLKDQRKTFAASKQRTSPSDLDVPTPHMVDKVVARALKGCPPAAVEHLVNRLASTADKDMSREETEYNDMLAASVCTGLKHLRFKRGALIGTVELGPNMS